MGRLLVAALGVLLVVSVGCSSSDMSGGKHSGHAMKASADVCAHCPGVQKAAADGTCPVCDMKVGAKTTGHEAAHGAATQAAAGVDACTHCAGVQTANAEGKCPACGMDLAKK